MEGLPAEVTVELGPVEISQVKTWKESSDGRGTLPPEIRGGKELYI